jgi:biotin carboxylase
MKKTIATLLATLTALFAPGFASYAAAAGMMQSGTGAKAPTILTIPSITAPSLTVPAGSVGRQPFTLPGAETRSAGTLPTANAIGAVKAAAAVPSLPKAVLPAAAPAASPKAAANGADRAVPAAFAQMQGASDELSAEGKSAPNDGSGPNPGSSKAFDGSAPQKKAILLVGTSGTRPFILTETKRVADELGLSLYLVDKASAREASKDVIPDSNFIAAPIDNHDEKTAAEIVQQLALVAKDKAVEAVVTFLNPYAQLAGDIVDRAGVKGLSGLAVKVAHTKSLARQALAGDADVATPARIVTSAAEAKAFFEEQGGGKIVMKPIKGGGSQGVITDIETAEQAAAAYDRLDAELIAFAKRPDAGFFNLDQHPGIMVEQQLQGPEVDVELVLQDGKVVGPLDSGALVSDNAPMDKPNAVEKNSTYPSVMPAALQKQLGDAAAKAARLMGIKDGNVHAELMMTPDGPRVLEINARMGGAFVWEFVQDSSDANLIEQGIRAVLGLPVKAGRTPNDTIEARFFIPAATGTIEAIDGLEALEAVPGFIRAKMLKKVGDRVKAAPDDAFDYIGYIGVRGKDYDEAMARTMKALEGVKIRIRKDDGTPVEQTGAYTHGKVDTLAQLSKEQQPKKGALDTIRSLPKSFLFGFTPGWTVNAVGAEIQAVALPLFTAALFDLPTALLVTGVGYVLRVAGAWMGSALMNRFNPVKVNNTALLAVALSGVALAVAAMLGAGSGVILGLLLFNTVIGGLAYGITRGVAENLLPRMILGKKHGEKLEVALNFAYQWVELGSIVAALWVAVPLLNLVGGPWMIAISSVLIGVARMFYATIKFEEPWKKPAPVAAKAAQAGSKATSTLTMKDFVPVAFFRFMHFLMYGVMATVLALSVFKSAGAAGVTIGVYDGGSWLFSLLASLSLLPKFLGRRSSVVLGAIAAAAFAWSAVVAPVLPLTAALGGLLGGLITVITNKWMPFYSKNMSEQGYRNLSKWLMTASIGALIPIFAAVSAIRLSPAVAAVFTMPMLLTGIAAVITAVGVLLTYWMLKDKKGE